MPRWNVVVALSLSLATCLPHQASADTESPSKAVNVAQPASNMPQDPQRSVNVSKEEPLSANSAKQDHSYWELVDGDTVPIHLSNEDSKESATFVTVQVAVNGTTGTFVLDTGATTVFLSPGFATALSLPATGTLPVLGFGGVDERAKLVSLRNITLGRSVLHDVKAVVTPLHVPIRVDGVLGYPVFSSAMMSVLFYQRQLILHDPRRSALRVAPESYTFDVDLSRLVPSVEGKLDGSTFRAVIDTGNAFELVLPPRFSKTTDATPSWSRPAAGLGGVRAMRCSLVDAMSLGAFQAPKQVACFSGLPVFGANAGSVGTTLLRHYDWTIDYPDKKFVLTPNGL